MGKLVFVWDNFGPLHADRCNAVAKKFAGEHDVIGLELAGKSKVYGWVPEAGISFRKITIDPSRSFEEIPFSQRFSKALSACRGMGRDSWFFFCHYQDPAIFCTAVLLRALSRRVFTMGCSKFDDYPRKLRREFLKALLYMPYGGAIASGVRSSDYMRFMGFAGDRVYSGYNTVSLDRIRQLAGSPAAPDGASFHDRHFTVVARLVSKKNIGMLLHAMKAYARQVPNPRALEILGSGPLESALRSQVRELGIEHLVHFRGFLQTSDVSKVYARSLALLLPSIEEQFGNVIPEAQAMGLPVIVSENCGGRDMLVRSGVNGFVIEPDNPRGLAFFMGLLSEGEALWRKMCHNSQSFVEHGDSARFAEAVEALIRPRRS